MCSFLLWSGTGSLTEPPVVPWWTAPDPIICFEEGFNQEVHRFSRTKKVWSKRGERKTEVHDDNSNLMQRRRFIFLSLLFNCCPHLWTGSAEAQTFARFWSLWTFRVSICFRIESDFACFDLKLFSLWFLSWNMRRRGGDSLSIWASGAVVGLLKLCRSFVPFRLGFVEKSLIWPVVFVCLCSCVTELLGVAARPAQSVVVSEELALLQGDLQQGRKLLLFLSLTCGWQKAERYTAGSFKPKWFRVWFPVRKVWSISTHQTDSAVGRAPPWVPMWRCSLTALPLVGVETFESREKWTPPQHHAASRSTGNEVPVTSESVLYVVWCVWRYFSKILLFLCFRQSLIILRITSNRRRSNWKEAAAILSSTSIPPSTAAPTTTWTWWERRPTTRSGGGFPLTDTLFVLWLSSAWKSLTRRSIWRKSSRRRWVSAFRRSVIVFLSAERRRSVLLPFCRQHQTSPSSPQRESPDPPEFLLLLQLTPHPVLSLPPEHSHQTSPSSSVPPSSSSQSRSPSSFSIGSPEHLLSSVHQTLQLSLS